MADMKQSDIKIGIIAGSGELPQQLVTACLEDKRAFHVIALEDITDQITVQDAPHDWVHIGKVGKIIKTLKKNDVTHIILAGKVGRPNPSALNLDFSGVKLLIHLQRLDSRGDDKIFSTIISYIEKHGFEVIGAEDILTNLLITEGEIGDIAPDEIAANDIAIGVEAALMIGKLDIGQAVIVQAGQILGVEGPEGTDRLVARCKEFHSEEAGGVLVKVKKPHQDQRVDLPSIGIHTVENAYNSGLRGIAVEAGGSLVINRPAVVARANELGVFVMGINPESYK